jgi:hypothetical protein
VVAERRCDGYAFGARCLDASAIPAFAEQLGQARMRPLESANTRAKRSETCDPQ